MGNGVFLSPTTIATVGHVTEGMLDGAGGEVILGWSDGEASGIDEVLRVPVVDITYHETGLSEQFSLIKLEAGVLGRTEVGVRFSPLVKDEPVFSVHYSQDLVLNHAVGWHRVPARQEGEASSETEAEPLLLFQLLDKQNKDVLDVKGGVSGGPVFDCQGRVVSLIADIITHQAPQYQGFTLPPTMRDHRLLPPSIAAPVETWQQKPNVAGIPSSVYIPE